MLLAWCNNSLDSTDFLLAVEPKKRGAQFASLIY